MSIIYKIGNKTVTREEFLADAKGVEAGAEVMTQLPACWPMKSECLGVHPDQIGDAVKEAERLGVPTEFTKDGRPVLTSRGHYKRYAEALGYYDRNGGYGSPQRK